ncbi:MAG: hypothetical protein ABIH11_09015 [Candidatus Altiarchaeota archaeon]
MPEATVDPSKRGSQRVDRNLAEQGFTPEDMNTPIKDLEPVKRRIALQPLVKALSDTSSRILNTPIGELNTALKHGDDLTRLYRYLEGGTPIMVSANPLDGVTIPKPPPDILLAAEAKKANLRATRSPRGGKFIRKELYEMLNDESYIVPRLNAALEQLIANGYISNPLELGAVRYVRKNEDVRTPPETDVGCVLVFHPATRKGASAEDRNLSPRRPVSVEFDAAGNITKMKEYSPAHGRKLLTPINAYIDIVDEMRPGDEETYYYRRLKFEPIEVAAGELDEKARRIVELGERDGTARTFDGSEIRFYNLKRPRDVDEVGFGVDRIGLVTEMGIEGGGTVSGLMRIVETPCIQSEVGGVRFGIHLEPNDLGVPSRETLESRIHEIASQENQWTFSEPRMSYTDRKGEIRRVLTDLSNASPPVLMADPASRMESQARFLEEMSPAVPYLIELKHKLPEFVRQTAAEVPGESPELNKLATASYAQLFQAAASMVGKGRAVNILWPLESVDNFLEGYLDYLEANDREYAMTVGHVVQDAVRPLNLQNQSRIISELQQQGEMTRRHISFEAGRIREEIGETEEVMLRHLDKIGADGERHVGRIAEALPLMQDVLEEIGADTTRIREALRRKDTTLVLEAGISTFFGGAKLKREISLGSVDDAVIRGAERIREDVRHEGKISPEGESKLGRAMKIIGGSLRSLARMMKRKDIPRDDVVQLNELLTYEALSA